MSQFNICSFGKTGPTPVMQMGATCIDCFFGKKNLICRYCLVQCHKNHKKGKLEMKKFYCSCGSVKMCSKLSLQNRNYVIENKKLFDKNSKVSGRQFEMFNHQFSIRRNRLSDRDILFNLDTKCWLMYEVY